MVNKYCCIDIETTLTCFLIVMKDFQSKKSTCYKISKHRNDYDKLVKHWKSLIKRNYYFVGFNNLGFDSQVIEFILKKPRTYTEIYEEAQRVINLPDENKWEHVIPEWKLSFKNLDLFKIMHYDNKNKSCSLKHAEYSMRLENIEEMPLAHNISYTLEQELLTEEYCENDVLATETLLSKMLDMVELRFDIQNQTDISCLNMNNGKIGMEILLTEYCKATGYSKKYVKTLDKKTSYRVPLGKLIYPHIKFKTPEFNSVLENFKDIVWGETTSDDEKGLFKLNYKDSIGSAAYVYGYGGLHQSTHGVFEADENTVIMDCDVGSLYPSIPISYYKKLLETMSDDEIKEYLTEDKPCIFPPHLGLEILKTYKNEIVDKRLAEKAKPKLEQNKTIISGYKEAANIPYGKSGEITSWFYSKEYNLTTTINGQLLISMLTESLYEIPNVQMLQNNTDGITVKFEKKYLDLYYQKCKEFEDNTYLVLEYAEYSRMVIINVNNYLAVYTNGKIKRKGSFEIYEDFVSMKSYHKNPSFLIIPLAIQEYFVNKTPIRDFIKNHQNIYDFCGLTKRKGAYKLCQWDKNGNKTEFGKIVRYYISKSGGYLIKDYGIVQNSKGKKIHKIDKVEANNGVRVLNHIKEGQIYDIDYTYYIKATEKIIFEIQGDRNQTTLF